MKKDCEAISNKLLIKIKLTSYFYPAVREDRTPGGRHRHKRIGTELVYKSPEKGIITPFY